MPGAAAGRKGRKNEYRSIRMLERMGYQCIRAAGSHGPFDLAGFCTHSIVLVQCKSNGWPSPAEIEAMQDFPTPSNVAKMIHRWNDREKFPMVKEVK
jgi:hypothetical protein